MFALSLIHLFHGWCHRIAGGAPVSKSAEPIDNGSLQRQSAAMPGPRVSPHT
jgi:hypothetical protein